MVVVDVEVLVVVTVAVLVIVEVPGAVDVVGVFELVDGKLVAFAGAGGASFRGPNTSFALILLLAEKNFVFASLSIFISMSAPIMNELQNACFNTCRHMNFSVSLEAAGGLRNVRRANIARENSVSMVQSCGAFLLVCSVIFSGNFRSMVYRGPDIRSKLFGRFHLNTFSIFRSISECSSVFSTGARCKL